MFGIGIVLWLAACSSTRLPTGVDAGAEVNPATDTILVRDTPVPGADATPVTADATPPIPDTRLPRPDTRLPTDAGPAAIDVGAPDAAGITLDTSPVTADAGTVLPDTATTVPDTAPVRVDSARPVDPYANRTFRIDTEHPAPTPDTTCTQNGPADYFQFTFGPRTTTLTVLMVSGSAAQRFQANVGLESDKLTFHFDTPLGGIVTFERDQDTQVAQAIVYGSGVSVIRCLRGALIPQP